MDLPRVQLVLRATPSPVGYRIVSRQGAKFAKTQYLKQEVTKECAYGAQARLRQTPPVVPLAPVKSFCVVRVFRGERDPSTGLPADGGAAGDQGSG